MKSVFKTFFYTILIASIFIFTSCSNTDSNVNSKQKIDSSTVTLDSDDHDIEPGYEKYKGTTLTYWLPFTSTLIQSQDENIVYQEMEKRTGIKIEFINPPTGQENENFNLMISAGELPDIIQDMGYPGGGQKAIEDGIYLKLNDLLDKYAPNYTNIIKNDDEIARECKEDDGTIWCFKCLQLSEEPSWIGPIIRKDYLDKLNLDPPKTIDDWYVTLKAFKEKLNVETPLLFPLNWLATGGVFVSAYDTNNDFINKNGTIKFGPTEPGFKDFLRLLNKWYEEGLIDKDFATRDTKSFDAQFTSGKAGAISSCLYGSFGPYISAGKQNNPDFEFCPVSYPVLNKGDDVSMLNVKQKNFKNRDYIRAISADCKNVEAAIKWLDYGYSDDGYMLYGYGKEGLTYDWVDGAASKNDGPDFFPPTMKDKISKQHPEFTDFMINNPDGIDFWLLIEKYKVHCSSFLRNPFAYHNYPLVYEAMDIWNKPGDSYVIPQVSFTDEESRLKATIMNTINTYKEEMIFKFITSEESLDNFDKYVDQIKELQIDKVIKIYQDALERYNNR